MRVFISWSGEPSRSIARSLKGWIESILPPVDPWMSDEEIGSGTRWSDELARALDLTDFGIICVSRDNQHAPWLIFEAGALAKRLDTGRVVPLCIDLPPPDITGPLAAFQGRSLDEAGVRRLVHDLNQMTEKPLARDRLDKVLDTYWSGLEQDIADALQRVPAQPTTQRSTKDMVAEVIETVRRLERLMAPQSYGSATAAPWDSGYTNHSVSASKGPPVGPDLSGRAYVASSGPVEPPEAPTEPSKSEPGTEAPPEPWRHRL
jgi:hypothetical protein